MADTVFSTDVILVPQSGNDLTGLLKEIRERLLQMNWRPRPLVLSAEDCLLYLTRANSSRSLHENTVLILESFKNRRLVESHSHTARVFVFGSPAIAFFLDRKAPFPNWDSPIWSVAFFGCEVCSSGLAGEERRRVEKQLRWLGAVVSKAYHEQVTFVIVDDTQTRKYRAACQQGAVCLQSAAVSDAYVRSCVDSSFRLRAAVDSATSDTDCDLASQMVYASQTGMTQTLVDRVDATQRETVCAFVRKWKTGPFSKLEVCSSKLYEDAKTRIQQLVEAGGGVYRGDLQHSCTHLVMDEPGGEKYEFARRSQRIHIVRTAWVFDSVSRGYAQDPAEYSLDSADPDATCLPVQAAETVCDAGDKRAQNALSVTNLSVSFNNVCASSRIDIANDTVLQARDNSNESRPHSPFRRPLAPVSDRQSVIPFGATTAAPTTAVTTTNAVTQPFTANTSDTSRSHTVTLLRGASGTRDGLFGKREKQKPVCFAIAFLFDVAKRAELATQLLEHGATIIDLFNDEQLVQAVRSACESQQVASESFDMELVLIAPLLLTNAHISQLASRNCLASVPLSCYTACWLARCLHSRECAEPSCTLDVPVVCESSASSSTLPVRYVVATITGFEDFEAKFIKETVKHTPLPLLFQSALAKGRDEATQFIRPDDPRLSETRDVEELLRNGTLSGELLSDTRNTNSALYETRATNRSSAQAVRTDVLVCGDHVTQDVLRTSKKTVAARKWHVPVVHVSWIVESLRRGAASLIGVQLSDAGAQKCLQTDDALTPFDADSVAASLANTMSQLLSSRLNSLTDLFRNFATNSASTTIPLQSNSGNVTTLLADAPAVDNDETQPIFFAPVTTTPRTSAEPTQVIIDSEPMETGSRNGNGMLNVSRNEKKGDNSNEANGSVGVGESSPVPTPVTARSRISLSAVSLSGTPQFVDSPNSNSARKRTTETPPLCDQLNNVLVGRLRKQARLENADSPAGLSALRTEVNANDSALATQPNAVHSSDLPPLRGVRLAFARAFTDPQRVRELINIAKQLGADVLLSFDSRCTHLVYETASGASSRKNTSRVPKDVAAALDASRIVVSPFWLLDSSKAERRLDERDYPFTYHPNKSLAISGAPSLGDRRTSLTQRRSVQSHSQHSTIELNVDSAGEQSAPTSDSALANGEDVKAMIIGALHEASDRSVNVNTPPQRTVRGSRTQPGWAAHGELDTRTVLSDTIAAGNYDSGPDSQPRDVNRNELVASKASALETSLRSPAAFAKPSGTTPRSAQFRTNPAIPRDRERSLEVPGHFEVLGIEHASSPSLNGSSENDPRISELVDQANKSIWCASSSGSSANDSHPITVASLPLSTQSPVAATIRQLQPVANLRNRSVADPQDHDAVTVTWNTDAEIQIQRARSRTRKRNEQNGVLNAADVTK